MSFADRPDSGHSPWLHRFAVFTALCTFLLVIAGGLVTSTESGLAVPDWPLSYGQLMPPMTGGILYEHGHRIVATFVGLLTVVLAVWIWRKENRSWVRILAAVALGSVIVQGILGGVTVLFLLPVPVSVAHAVLAQSFFSLMVVVAFATSSAWGTPGVETARNITRTRDLAAVAAAAVFVQLILGAIMRHTDSGLAIPDFPLSYGSILPPLGSEALDRMNSVRTGLGLGPVTMAQVWIHFAHRAGALITTILVIGNALHVLRNFKRETRLREPALSAILLVLVQVLLGGLAVWTGTGVEIATSHVAVGALLLGTTVLSAVRSYSLFMAPERPSAMVLESSSR
jgi:cytochrome c oxidase assembly protein subunit 15